MHKRDELYITELQYKIQDIKAGVADRISNALGKNKKLLEDREQKIIILKEMIRGTQGELKQRNTQIRRIKQMSSQIPTMRPPSSINSDTSMLRDSLLEDESYGKIANSVSQIQEQIDKLETLLHKRKITPADLEMHKFPRGFDPKEFVRTQFEEKVQESIRDLGAQLSEMIVDVKGLDESCGNARLRMFLPSKKKITKQELIEILEKMVKEVN